MGRQDLEALARQIEAAEANGEVTGRLLADALSEAFPAQVEAIRRLGRQKILDEYLVGTEFEFGFTQNIGLFLNVVDFAVVLCVLEFLF